MIKLDDNLLAELGLQSLPTEEKKNLLRHIYETLEMRVGTTLAQQMTDSQLDEFEGFINANDEAGALRWLETNFPNYKDVVAHEFEKLKAEVRQAAPQILASVQAPQYVAPATAPMQQMPSQSPQYQQPPMPQYAANPMQAPQLQTQPYGQMPPQQQPMMNPAQQPYQQPQPPVQPQTQAPYDQSQYDTAA